MRTAQSGDKVRVHYTGARSDGNVFDSSSGGAPLEFTIGQSQIMPSFEREVVGMRVGESKTVQIPAEQAYGQRMPERVLTIGRDQFPPTIQPEVGLKLEMRREGGDAVAVTVTEVSQDEVTVDANHPLAGEDLTFEIKLIAVE